jgi:hypothetical protein
MSIAYLEGGQTNELMTLETGWPTDFISADFRPEQAPASPR